jgi:hypothetical protein
MFALSRTCRWLKTKWIRDWCARVFGVRWQKKPKVRSRYILPYMEALEDRTLLSVTYSVSGDEISFSGSDSDNIYLEATAGSLSYSTDNVTFIATAFTLDSSSKVKVSTDGTLYIESMTQAGGTFTATGAVVVAESVMTNGQTLSITGMNVTVGTPVLGSSGTMQNGTGTTFVVSDADTGTQSLILSPQGGTGTLAEGEILTFTGTSGTGPYTLQNSQAYVVHIINQSDPTSIQVQLYPQTAQPVTISTSNGSGDAGDLTLSAQAFGLDSNRSVIIAPNGQLQAQGVSVAGDGSITVSASRVTDDQTGISLVSQIEDFFLHNFVATVSVGQNVTITGGNVSITATSGDDGLFENCSIRSLVTWINSYHCRSRF